MVVRRHQNVLEHAETIPPFEVRLGLDSRWALTEGSMFFEGQGAVQETLRKITTRLRDLGIPYAVVGGMALFNHGLRRFTEDVDLLVTLNGLKEIHQQLEGLGYLPLFEGGKNLRDTETGVKIEFLVTGGFPGDGKPKPVSFPDPATVAIENDGIRYVNLPTLIELKIASGITNTGRMKDLADVQELIKILNLPKDFSKTLNPYVDEKYQELWTGAKPTQKRYVRVWHPGKQDDYSILQAMVAEGVALDHGHATAGAFVYLVTNDPILAKKYDMHDESEVWDEPDESSS